MTSFNRTGRLARLALSLSACGLLAGLAACSSGDSVATASSGTFGDNYLKQTLSGAGIVGDRRKGRDISYRARSPLVLPPSYSLRQPEPEGATVQANANWPADPDRLRREREAELASLTPEEYERRQSMGTDAGRLLEADEMGAGRRAGANRGSARDMEALREAQDNPRLMPSQLRVARSPQEDAARTSGPEPQRRYLTEPPPGYRTPVVQSSAGAEAAKKAEEARQTGRRDRSGILGRILPF